MTDYLRQWAERVAYDIQPSGFPLCPYAERALVKDTLSFSTLDRDHEAELSARCAAFPFDAWRVEVIVVENLGFADTKRLVKRIAPRYPALELLIDDPHIKGKIGGLWPSNGRDTLIILQERAVLEKLRAALGRTTYYDNWNRWYRRYITGQ